MGVAGWGGTALGPPDQWPDALRTLAFTIAHTAFPQAIIWGDAGLTLYNEAFAPLLGDRHPAFGTSFAQLWPDAGHDVAAACAAARAGDTLRLENCPLPVIRDGHPETAHFTFCYSPAREADGAIAGVLATLVETSQTVRALEQQRRLAFLDLLTREVQQAADAGSILAITTRLVAEHLDLSNCAYADMDPDQDGFTIRGDWAAPGSPTIVGHYSLADFGTRAVADLGAGRPLIINDNLAELLPHEAATFRDIGIAATICMPLIRDGRLTALMAIHDKTPRRWSDYDLAVIREVTERSWAHVERVRAEDELRRAQEAGGVGLFTADIPAGTVQGTPQFFRLFGLDFADSVPISDFEQLILPEDADIGSNPRGRAAGTSPVDVEYRIRRADTGEIRTIARKAEYEFDVRGRPLRMLGAVRDVTIQRDAQRALAASEAQFRSLAEALPALVWTAPASGEIDWLNERVYRYAGAAPGTLDDAARAAMIHEDDREEVLSRWLEARRTENSFEMEYRLRRADGAYRWHLSRAIPIRDEAGRVRRWVGTGIDIHERVLAAAASQRERERMWAMSQDLLLLTDDKGVIIDVSPSACRILHRTPEDMIGRPVLEYVHPDDHAATLAELRDILSGATTLSFENRYRTREGDYRLLNWTAIADGPRIHAAGRDITDSRSIERDQARIWALSPVLKMVASREGHVRKVNPAWRATLGWQDHHMVGRALLDFVAESDRERLGAALERLLLGEALDEQEYGFQAADGGQRQIAWSFVGEGDHIFGFGRDMTEQRIAEDALRQSQKMEAVGQLTGGIAHDFNNLLQGVTGNLELMQHRLDQGRLEGIERFIKGAATSANRASALTHRLLAFSRRQPLDPRPVRANPLIGSMEDMLRRTLGEIIDLDLILAPDLWVTRCDANQLESAVLNLAINARDAMPGGGKLVIETCNSHIDDLYAARRRDVAPGQYVCVSVTDTGVGMDAQTIARAFEPFFTTKPIGQGTGLGLSMIYGFARQSEGYAKIYSEKGKGTTIKLFLPRHRGDAQEEESAPQLSIDHLAEAGETVLVVEDEPVVRGLIVEVLGELGYAAIEAEDGPSGLAILQSQQRIDLLVTDIGLPGLNGRQVADGARVTRPDLKILFMTGYAENAALATGFLEPGMAMITKPFAMEASRIREMIGR